MEGGPGHPHFPGHPDYLWMGLTHLLDRCPDNRRLVQKNCTPIPSNSRFQPPSPTGVQEFRVQRRFWGHLFLEWDKAV